MKNRVLALLLTLALLVSLVPAVFATEQGNDDPTLKITHVSLDPAKDALGFKATVEGDLSTVTEMGFCFRVNGGAERTYTIQKTLTDGTFSVRVKNILANNGGEANLEAYAFVVVNGETIQTEWQATSMKQALQAVNTAWAGYNQTQKAAVKALCTTYEAQVASWGLTNIFGHFFESTNPQVNLSEKDQVTVASNGISFGYINGFAEENFYFEAKFHTNDVAIGENWPKFGLMAEGDNVREYFYVDMNRAMNASVVGNMTNTNGQDDWDHAKSVTVEGMAFSGNGETVTLGVLKEGKRLHLFVDGRYVMSSVCGFEGKAKAGIFSFNTGLTVTDYAVTTAQADLDAKNAMLPEAERNKGEIFGSAEGDGIIYSTSDGVDLSKDQGSEPSVSITGGAPQYTYLNDIFTDKFCFETEINVSQVLNNDNWPKFGILVNGTSEMVKFFVDMNPQLAATHVGVVYQPTDGGDDWAGSVSAEVPGMSFSGSDTIKLKLVRDGSAYYFFVNGKLALHNVEGFHDAKGAVGIFSFNSVLTATNYSVAVGQQAVDNGMTIGMTENWFTQGENGEYTLSTDSDAQHKVDDLTRGGIAARAANYRVSGKLSLTDASAWGQARILISADPTNEYFIALEQLPAGNYQIFIMSKANQDNWDAWVKIGETGKNTLNFELVVSESQVTVLLDDMICYETDRVTMAESTVKFTGYNIGTTTVADLDLEIFSDSQSAANYLSGKSYKPQGMQEATLSTNWFAQGEDGEYTLFTDSDAQHKVDDVLANGVIMRSSMYCVKGKLSLTDAADWGQARILISADARNEYFIALEKTNNGIYQIFTMSKADQDGWDNWVKICDTGKNVQDFELIVNGNKVYFLVDGKICYETDRVTMTDSTVKFTGYNIGTTTVEDLQLTTFDNGDAISAYIAQKEHKTEGTPETLLSTNYFTETSEGVYTLTTNSDAQHLVDDVMADGFVMRDDFYAVSGQLTLKDAADWGQARILISADARNEYFVALEKLPSGNYQIFTMSKADQDSWDVWQAVADENTNGKRNSVAFELVVLGGQVNLLLDGKLVYQTSRVPMTESTVKFTGFNNGTTVVEDLVALRFASQAEAENYLLGCNTAKNVSYKNQLDVLGADPSVIAITEGKDAGSYYMYITSDSLGCKGYLAYRSWDLVNWECVSTALHAGGAYYDATAGRTIASYLTTDYWAPEVIYDAQTKLYYMFYNADRYDNQGYFYGDIAVASDPAGPFVPYNKYLHKNLVQIDAENDIWAYEPVFDFTKMDVNDPLYETANNGYMKIIDLSPFVDPVTGQKYVYFCHDLGKAFGYTMSSNYVMKLNDDYTPDYTSVKHLTTAESTLKEGSVNEAPFVLYKSGKYYLLYSVNNYKNVGYSVRVAVSDSPDGTFTKLTDAQGGYLLYGTDKGTGHCSVVSRDGQDYIVYHAHKVKTSDSFARGIAVDTLNWTQNSSGLLVPVVSGPSFGDMPLTAGEYTNVADNATVTNLVSGSVNTLTDGIIAHRTLKYVTEAVFSGEATIRLDFAKTTVYGIGIYDGVDQPCAGVKSVRLILANGDSICYTGVAADQILKTVPAEAVAVEIQMADSAQYAISEVVVLAKN
ncbi:MAG: family 43 glycosylhydrolase [Oscillospiraceae bacterium]|nr:family 43 glycosylhydrolase [Oscillospiraceae bacterium]